MSELCKCGHDNRHHRNDGRPGEWTPCVYTSSSSNAPGSMVHHCPCPAFTPAEPATDDLRAGIERVLGEHEARWTTHGYERPYDVMHCASPDCDWSLRVKVAMTATECIEFHRAHVAAQLVEHINRKEVAE